MTGRRSIPLLVWLVLMMVGALIVHRAPFLADMSVFLPRNPTAEQRLLVENLKSGVLTRILLVAVDGVTPEEQPAFSREMAKRLNASGQFQRVNNGDRAALEADQKLLFERRYLLSPAVTPEHFEAPALRAALQTAIEDLASSQSTLLKQLITRDPTGEVMRLLSTLESGGSPRSRDGVWISPDGARLMLMTTTRASGNDVDGQQHAIEAAQRAFGEVKTALASASMPTLTITGPGAFAVESRRSIEHDVSRLSLIGTSLILAMLWFIFRSPVAIGLAIVPMVTAVLAGASAVALVFGNLHGLTLGFGITLIGEAVDYALYQLIRSDRLDASQRGAFWRTIALGVCTSIIGFSALAFSGFPGLTQMAVFSIAGLLAAVIATRYVLPALTPPGFRPRDLTPVDRRLHAGAATLRRLGVPMAMAAIVAAGVVWHQRDQLWDDDISSLNPISAASKQLDEELRGAVGAPDVSVMVIVTATDQETALQGAEQVGQMLDRWVSEGRLGGYDSPATYFPSVKTQMARRDALPTREVLTENLRNATQGLPLRAERLSPFVDQVEAARTQPLITRADFTGTQLGLKVESLLTAYDDKVAAVIALRAPVGATVDEAALASSLPAIAGASVALLDLKRESDRLYGGYLHEAIGLSAGGALAIIALLALAIRTPRHIITVCAPLLGAVVLTLLLFVLTGHKLSLLHLIGLLLVVAVGSNYTLFFRALGQSGARHDGTLTSLAFANLATVIGFGVLAGSTVPLLSALGGTVAIGAAFALLLACVWSKVTL